MLTYCVLPPVSETVQELDLELEQPVRMEEETGVELQVEEEHEVKKESPCVVGPNTQGVIRGSDLFGYVGIEAVLDQMKRKTMKSAFEFNIMVVGKFSCKNVPSGFLPGTDLKCKSYITTL